MNTTLRCIIAAITLVSASAYWADNHAIATNHTLQSMNATTIMPGITARGRAASEPISFDFGYCYDARNCVGMSGSEYQKFAIYIPEETVKRYAGATVDAAVIANGAIPKEEYSNFKIGIFKGCDDETPLVGMDANMPARHLYEWTTYEFPEPYVIKADEPFYLIMTWPVRSYPRNEDDLEDNYFPCATDQAMVPDDRGYSDLVCSIDLGSGEMEWWNYGPLCGNNCMRLRLSGDNLPQDEVVPFNIYVPSRVAPGEPFEGYVSVVNYGANPVWNCKLLVQVGDDEPVEREYTFMDASGRNPEPLKYHEAYGVDFLTVTDQVGPYLEVKVTVAEVNGVPNGETENNWISTVTPSFKDEDGYERALYVEEVTGTWCGWCPMGIVAFEQMRHSYPDRFAGIAIHVPTDPMVAADGSFDDVAEIFGGSAPAMSVNMNRDPDQLASPSPYNMHLAFDFYATQLSYVKPTITVTDIDDSHVSFTADFEFAGDAENIYTVYYIVTEDNVGPHLQKNDFPTGIQDIDGMEKWEKDKRYVETIFNDVARTRVKISDTSVIFPEKIKGKTKYSHDYTITYSEATGKVKAENCNVIAMIANNINGLTENAAISRCKTFTSIEEIGEGESADAPVEYFDLGGRAVDPASAPAGIYIRRQGNITTKVAKH